MGLTSEERLTKFYWRMTYVQRHLGAMRDAIPKDMEHQWSHARGLVDRWSTAVNMMSGEMVKATDSSGLYWFLGSPEGDFRSSWADPFYLDRDDDLSLDGIPGDGFRNKMSEWSYREAAETWATPGDRTRAIMIGAWWDMWTQIGGTLYTVFRYKDALFDPISDNLKLWIGDLVNNRHYFATPQTYARELLNADYSRLAEVERALLCRYDLVHILAEPIAFGDAPTIAQENLMKKHARHGPRAGFATAWMRHNSDPTRSDFHDIVTYVGTLGLSTVRNILEEHEREKRERTVARRSTTSDDGGLKDRLLRNEDL